jgi:hypothetical protein
LRPLSANNGEKFFSTLGHKSNVFIRFELSLCKKRIPRFVGNASGWEKWTELLESSVVRPRQAHNRTARRLTPPRESRGAKQRTEAERLGRPYRNGPRVSVTRALVARSVLVQPGGEIFTRRDAGILNRRTGESKLSARVPARPLSPPERKEEIK